TTCTSLPSHVLRRASPAPRPVTPAGRARAFHAGHGGFAMSRSVKRVLHSFLVGLVLLFGQFASPPGAAGAVGSIKGRLLGPDGQGRPGVVLQLRNALSGFFAEATTGPDGGFDFPNVPFNPYLLQAEVPSFQAVYLQVEV